MGNYSAKVTFLGSKQSAALYRSRPCRGRVGHANQVGQRPRQHASACITSTISTERRLRG